MNDNDRIERFDVPTFEQLVPLGVSPEKTELIRQILADEVDPRDVSTACAQWYASCYHKPEVYGHEMKLEAINDLLDMHGVEALDIDGYYTDEGVRMCPSFSYCNAGDPYETTLLRDHCEERWIVACYGDVLEEREAELDDEEMEEDEQWDEFGEEEVE